MKRQFYLFVFLIVTSMLTIGPALATKPGVPWRVSIKALELESAQVDVVVIIEGLADVKDLSATVTSNNAMLLAGKETWGLAVHKGESIETRLRYRFISGNPAPQWRVLVSGRQQAATMSRLATTRLIKTTTQKIQSSHGKVRQGAEEYRAH